MLATTEISRVRGLETGFIVERYHRAFEAELRQLHHWLRVRPLDGGGFGSAVDVLAKQLRGHTAFQEGHLFPAFEAGSACPSGLVDAWAMDALRIFDSIDAARTASRSLGHQAPLVTRVCHLLDEVQDHLEAESKVLAGWQGFGV